MRLREADATFRAPTHRPLPRMPIDTDTVRKIAALARIEVQDDELAHLAGELSNIIGFVEQLAAVDTEGVAPLASVAHRALPRREDAVTDGDCAEAILGNAPERRDGFFVVPKVVE